MIAAITSLLVMISSLITGALGDGWNDKGKKTIGHAFKAAEVTILAMSPFILYRFGFDLSDWAMYGASYIALRIALFDPIRNLARGQKITFVGTSNLWDKVIKHIPGHGMLFIRGICLMIGSLLPFKLFVT